METIFVGSECVAVGELIGKGGEGQVYSLNGRSGSAVKIYDSRLRIEREEKVRAMVHGGFAAQTDLVAYPREVVSDRGGNFLGFLMQLVSGYRPVHELYSPKSRQRHFPKADYRFIIRAALNVARAVGKVHQTGCVIGDLNHSGVLVARDAKVALIDADSFHFRLGQKTYPCVVGVPDFLPPELHGVNLSSVIRSVEHDNFGLAVALFLLLFMGRHPYSGRYLGPDLSIGQAIAQNKFAFSLTRQSSTGTSPPPGSLTLDVFPAPVRQAFESAFGLNPKEGPSASSWIRVLTTLEGSLNLCNKFKTHFYPDSARVCLWCHLDRNGGGLDMFPDMSRVAPGFPGESLVTERAISEILALHFPTLADLIPRSMTSTLKGSSELQEAKSTKLTRALLGPLMLAGGGVGLFYAAEVWFIWLGLAGWGAVLVGNRKVDAKPFQDAFLKAEEALQRELNPFVGRNGLAEVVKVRGDLDTAIPSYRAIDDGLKQELVKLKSTREARQRTAFLDRFLIRNADISGIGSVRKATLVSFGIETAADITTFSVLQVPGFGDVMTRNLLDWRDKLESRFRYNPARNAQDIADEGRLRANFASHKLDLEATIRIGLQTLRAAKPKIDHLTVRARNDKAFLAVLHNWSLGKQDLTILGVPASNADMRTRDVLQPRPSAQGSKRSQGAQPAASRSKNSQGVPSCPQCGSAMRRRSGRYGIFWGCGRYPSCKGTQYV